MEKTKTNTNTNKKTNGDTSVVSIGSNTRLATNNQNTLNTLNRENEKDSEEFDDTLLMLVGVLLVLILVVGIICYLVYGIIYLVKDYDVANDCPDCNLWAYVLVAIILCFNKKNLSQSFNSIQEGITVLVLTFFLELGLSIWGGIELYQKASSDQGTCPDLRDSNLWKFGLATFVIQIITISLLILIPVAICVINRRIDTFEIENTENTEKAENTEIVQISNSILVTEA
tara:strand:+ start:1575 stop:2261 length:687 start_codon:yes stop_codon:yes gene_type:complete